MPFIGGPAAVFERQGRFHAGCYLAGLPARSPSTADRSSSTARSSNADGPSLRVNGRTPSASIGSSSRRPYRLRDCRRVRTRRSFRANSPATRRTSWPVASRRGEVPDALFWDTADPYHYCRIQPATRHDVIIFGGEDHKTGQASQTAICLKRLEETALRSGAERPDHAPLVGPGHRNADGLPYIGEIAPC